ncbi:MAG TPA: FAD:protein FMN transferase [Candidatus Cloacimonas sp.]|jgi:thiamine biosynthesis lipoprotein|nr:FAD:protein FMN transferase [Candidatus Cloacimonas sp.]MDD2249551.1 FAD:protein FMN transferase [Candidatus Cloacimonadota bacterium]MCK9157225.1 FAD:protein FMN transferase [Candidatus Cloacimonas sp.]MDD3733351.1 FAD:protein FMN transferase [Candidatus Cloacimonadota bacterium]MDD4676041.1 FAD:protein FMN transferase [Candidatus Cloacimonadota bacterium]
MNRREIISLIILIVVIGFGAYKYLTRSFTELKSQYLMDTIVEISATSQSKNVGRQIDSVFNFIRSLEDKLNEYDPNSYLGKINADSLNTVFDMDPDMYNLLTIADSLFKMTNGAFDPTIKPVWDLWNFNAENPVPPDSLVLKEMLSKVDFTKIRYDEKRLIKPLGMQLTFGAIAKGYILDKARDHMQTLNLDNGYINCRSSMTFFGYKKPQIVYIQHPRKLDDYIASFKVLNQSISTSGDYQQFYEYNGVRYHHIISPFTGYPVPDVHSVTVLCSSAAWSDGISTALFLLPPETVLDSIKQIADCEAIIYYSKADSLASIKTAGMKDKDLKEKL